MGSSCKSGLPLWTLSIPLPHPPAQLYLVAPLVRCHCVVSSCKSGRDNERFPQLQAPCSDRSWRLWRLQFPNGFLTGRAIYREEGGCAPQPLSFPPDAGWQAHSGFCSRLLWHPELVLCSPPWACQPVIGTLGLPGHFSASGVCRWGRGEGEASDTVRSGPAWVRPFATVGLRGDPNVGVRGHEEKPILKGEKQICRVQRSSQLSRSSLEPFAP